ncbi:DUF5687 family protein [Sinomicrobium sp.]
MIKSLINLQWKSFFRSASLGKELALRIVMGLFAAYFMLSFLALGVVLYPMIEELYPGQDPLTIVNGMVLQVVMADLLMLFFLRSIPTLSIKPLLVLPLKKGKLIHFLLLKSIFSVFNLFLLLIALPFSIYTVVKGVYGLYDMAIWAVAITALVFVVNYADFFLKQRFSSGLAAILPYVAVVLGLVALEYTGVLEVRKVFGQFLGRLPATPVLLLVLFLLPVVLYWLNYRLMRTTFYLDRSISSRETDKNVSDMGWVRRFGDVAPFLQLDLKLIWRNKRAKATLWMSLFFLTYGLIFYANPVYENMSGWYVFVGIFISGIFMINFGQFIPAWDSAYYGMLMAQPVSLEKYLSSKYSLLSFSTLLLFLLGLPYAYFGWDIVLLNAACVLYNTGVNIPILLFAGAYNKKCIDMDKSSFLNYQGTGIAQFILMIPLIIIPLLLWILCKAIWSIDVALYVIAILGLVGLVLRKVVIKYLAGLYKERKYIALDGFREKEN